MTSKNHPISFRQKRHNITDSLWHAQYNYSSILHDDLIIREIVKYTYQRQKIWVNQILIRRTLNSFYIIVYLYGSKLGRWVPLKRKIQKKLIKKKIKKKRFRYICNHFEERIEKMIREYCNIQDQQIYLMTYDYKKIYNLKDEGCVLNIQKSFRNFKWLKSFHLLAELAYISLKTQNTTAFCTCFSEVLTPIKNHKQLIAFVKDIFKQYSNAFKFFVGFRIMLKGRLNARLRAKKMSFQQGYLPLQTIMANVSYDLTTVYSKSGTFGLHIWLCFSHSTIYQIHAINHLRRYKKYYFEPFSKKFPTPYTLTSVPQLIKTIPFKKVYPYFSAQKQYPFFDSKIYTKILNIKSFRKISFNHISKRKEFLLWNFLNKFFLLKHKKYEPNSFLKILNYLIVQEENQYRFFFFKKLMIISLLKENKIQNKKKGIRKKSKKKTC